MTVRFLAPARLELDETHDWYEEQQAGLGLKFLEKVSVALAGLKKAPFSAPEIDKDVRSKIVAPGSLQPGVFG